MSDGKRAAENHGGKGSTSPRSRSSKRLVVGGAFIVVLAVLAVTGWYWIFSGGDESSSDADSVQDPDVCSSDQQPEQVSAPTDGDVTVADSGVDYVSSQRRTGGALSFGVELENATSLVATDVSVHVVVYDSEGKEVPQRDEESDWQDKDWLIPSIAPGKKFGFGGDGYWAYLDPGDSMPDGELTVKTEVSVGGWWKPNDTVLELSSIDAADIETQFDPWPGDTPLDLGDADSDEVYRNYVAFTVSSSFCDARQALGSAIFRNEEGAIIGGVTNVRLIVPDIDPDTQEASLPEDFDGSFRGLEVAEFHPGTNPPVLMLAPLAAGFWVSYSIWSKADPDLTEVSLA